MATCDNLYMQNVSHLPALVTGLAFLLAAVLSPFQTDMIDQVLSNASDMPPEAREFLEDLKTAPVMGAMAIVGFFVTLGVTSLFGLVGGLFGALFFRKSAPPPPPAFVPPTFNPPPPPTTWTPPPPPPVDRDGGV